MNDQSTTDPKDRQQGCHLDEHGCLDLLHGLLSVEEEERILAHLADCPACEKRLQERAADVARMEATRVLRFPPGRDPVLEKRGTAVRSPDIEKHRARGFVGQTWRNLQAAWRQPRFRLAGGLAGGLAVVAAVSLLIIWPHYLRTPEAPEAPGAAPIHLLPSYSFQLQPREVPGAGPREDLRAGLEAYENRDFERAVEALRTAREPELDRVHQMVRDIYLGSALAGMGKYEEAVEVLREVKLQLVPDPWGCEARWALYVALRGCGQEAAADSLLRVLASEPGEVGDRARRLWQR